MRMEEVFELCTRKIFDVLLGTIGGLGVLGLVLALLGLYGLMTYSVGLRQREIGIRMAIGADRTGVTVMMLKQGLVLGGNRGGGRRGAVAAGEQAAPAVGIGAVVQLEPVKIGGVEPAGRGRAGRVYPGVAGGAFGSECGVAAGVAWRAGARRGWGRGPGARVLLHEQDEWLTANLQAIDAQIRTGMEELERGEGIPEDQLDDFLARLKAQPE